MTTEVVLLTSSALRHDFVRQVFGLADGISVLRSYCEGSGDSLLTRAREEGDQVKIDHLERRARSERDFFGPFVEHAPDHSNPESIPDGGVNNRTVYEEICNLDPDLLVAYGCSIVENPLLSEYKGSFCNVHLGLSPYYRGAGTNFWPLVNEEPEYVGATFMHIDAGVDTGEIIHQLRARVHPGDGPHQIGNRLIADMATTYTDVVRHFDDLHTVEQPPEPDEERYYRSADYSTEATERLYENFENGLVETYLAERDQRVEKVPIVEHPVIERRSDGRQGGEPV